jgi:hypothetical protein
VRVSGWPSAPETQQDLACGEAGGAGLLDSRAVAATAGTTTGAAVEGSDGMLAGGEGECSINSDNGRGQVSGRWNERRWWGRVAR